MDWIFGAALSLGHYVAGVVAYMASIDMTTSCSIGHCSDVYSLCIVDTADSRTIMYYVYIPMYYSYVNTDSDCDVLNRRAHQSETFSQ